MREKFFLPATITACLLICGGLYFFVHQPAQSEISAMQLETRRLKQTVRELDELKTRHGNFSTLVAATERQLDGARNFLPATLMQEKFIDEIYRTADFNRVRIISVQAGEISDGEIQTQIVAVKLQAEYVELLNFVREIIDGERMVSLENFSVTADDAGILDCDLSFKIFAAPSSADN